MNLSSLTLISSLGGILPVLLWLFFWLREDRLHPEPKQRLIACFLTGMLAVVAVIPAERLLYSLLNFAINTKTLVGWAIIEESFKFAAAYLVALRSSDNDEPLDPVIYLIVTALGFSALENVFFLTRFLSGGFSMEGLVNGDMRFLGATVLHTVTSAAIGVFLSFSYYKSPKLKRFYLFTGLALAIALHAFFNLLIINSSENALLAFGSVWLAALVLIFSFEKIKTIRKIHLD